MPPVFRKAEYFGYIHGTFEKVIEAQVNRYEPHYRNLLEELVAFLDDFLSDRYTPQERADAWVRLGTDFYIEYRGLMYLMTLWRDLGKAKLAEFDVIDIQKTP